MSRRASVTSASITSTASVSAIQSLQDGDGATTGWQPDSLGVSNQGLDLGGSVITVGASDQINTQAAAQSMVDTLTTSQSNLKTSLSSLGSASRKIDAQLSFTSKLSDVVEASVGNLVDADLANNAASWQWVAGCGADAAPYFRVFNPVLQGEKFDPEGVYVRRFVPELARLPNRFIHRPWEADAATLRAAGVTLGANYPQPMVDHGEARVRALAAFAKLKQTA